MSKCTGENCPLAGNRKDCDLPMCPWKTEARPMREKVKERLEETYQEVKPYINDRYQFPTLYGMCEKCELWNGEEHDYEECRNRPCFINFLGYEYVNWCASWEEVV